MTLPPERQQLIDWITDAVRCGARLHLACQTIGLPPRTLQRWRQHGLRVDGRTTAIKVPANKLNALERAEILHTCAQAAYADCPPSQIVPRLADQGIYLASESSYYRILKAAGQLTHRGRAKKPRPVVMPTTHSAAAPNQVWTWDITYLPSMVKGQYWYLYLIEDLYSRKAVGWEVYRQESGADAADLLDRSVLGARCHQKPLVLHSDNGAPMKSSTLLAKMQDLGITPSRSRPRVSNDNPFSESLFRTLKYCPQWPRSGFASLEAAQTWVKNFVQWYNHEHRHSKIRFVTPAERHQGKDHDLLAKRHQVYQAAKAKNPNRWSGATRNWTPVGAVTLNPDKTPAAKTKAA